MTPDSTNTRSLKVNTQMDEAYKGSLQQTRKQISIKFRNFLPPLHFIVIPHPILEASIFLKSEI